jgi:hypothetical protein
MAGMHPEIDSMPLIPSRPAPWRALLRNLLASALAVAILSGAVAGISAIGSLALSTDGPGAPRSSSR